MDNQKFIEQCKKAISHYVQQSLKPSYRHLKGAGAYRLEEKIYVVWSCKTLQNNKALLALNVEDGMYYECTYNGDKCELYLDAYEKRHNEAIKIDV